MSTDSRSHSIKSSLLARERESTTFSADNLRRFQFSCHCRLRQTRSASHASSASTAQSGSLSPARFFNPYSIIFAAATVSRFRYLRDQLLHSDARFWHPVEKKKNYLDELAAILYFDYTAHSSYCACIEYVHIYMYMHFFFPLINRSISLSLSI